jgi:hypothetical protein
MRTLREPPLSPLPFAPPSRRERIDKARNDKMAKQAEILKSSVMYGKARKGR